MSAAWWIASAPWLAALVLLGASALLMLLPFVPAWREWRRPQDAAPLPLSPLVAAPQPASSGPHGAVSTPVQPASADAAAPTRSHRLPPGPFAAQSGQPLHWPAGQAFAWLQAPTVWLGQSGSAGAQAAVQYRPSHPAPPAPLPVATAPVSPTAPQTAPQTASHTASQTRSETASETVLPSVASSVTPASRPAAPLPGAQPWGAGGWRIDGDARLPGGQQLHGPLVVHGALQLEEASRIDGDVKVHGPVLLGPRSRIDGALVALHDVVLGNDSVVRGPLMVQGHLHLARGARIGEPARPTTASARWVTAASGSLLHGQLQARDAGVVL